MEDVSRSLPKYGKFSLHDITTGTTRLASRCAPASGCNVLFENCGDKEDLYEKNFLGEILGKTEKWFGSAGESSSESPLIQRFAEIFSLSDFRNTENRSIHIFSDMLQHDSGYSHHRQRVRDDEFAWLIQQPYYQQNKLELEGVSVYVYYLKRNKYRRLQTSAHKKFWKELFEDAGAAQVSLREINLPGEDSAVAPAVIDNRPAPPPKLVAPKPKPASPPPSNSSPEQQEPSTAPSAEDGAREPRDVDEALNDLLEKCSGPEDVKGIYNDLGDARISPETRGKAGELMLEGTCFPKNIKRAYLLIRCAWGYNEKISNLELQLDGNDIKSLKDTLSKMKGKGLCN